MSWGQLLDIAREARQLAAEDQAAAPTACPTDGVPLVTNSAGVLGCTFCGWRSTTTAPTGG